VKNISVISTCQWISTANSSGVEDEGAICQARLEQLHREYKVTRHALTRFR